MDRQARKPGRNAPRIRTSKPVAANVTDLRYDEQPDKFVPLTIPEIKRQLEELKPFVDRLAQEIAQDSLAALSGDLAAQQAVHEADVLRRKQLLRQELLENAIRQLQQQGRDARHPRRRPISGAIGEIQAFRNGEAGPPVEDRYVKLLPRLQGFFREGVLDYGKEPIDAAREAITSQLMQEPRLIWKSGGHQPSHDEQTQHEDVLRSWRHEVDIWADKLVHDTPLPSERTIAQTRRREAAEKKVRDDYQDSISADLRQKVADVTNRMRAKSGPL